MVLALVVSMQLAAAPFDLPSWNQQRLTTSRVSMFVLGGWAVANMGVGAVGFGLEKDERLRMFHLGNLVWNAVNLGLALSTLIQEWKQDPAALDAKQSVEAGQFIEKVFLVNAGLDVAYLATAAFLWQRGDATGDAKLVGFGQALLLQGAFLLLFDATMAVVHGRLNVKLLEHVTMSLTPAGLAATF